MQPTEVKGTVVLAVLVQETVVEGVPTLLHNEVAMAVSILEARAPSTTTMDLQNSQHVKFVSRLATTQRAAGTGMTKIMFLILDMLLQPLQAHIRWTQIGTRTPMPPTTLQES
jgi:hypothetical protein